MRKSSCDYRMMHNLMMVTIFVLCTIVMQGVFCMSARAEEEVALPISGVDGDLSWSIDDEGKLIVKGKGDYQVFQSLKYFPDWNKYAESITSAIVSVEDITNLSNFFAGCKNMTKVDLITGFLGSGKTTFIRKYVKYLLDKGERVCILENDYGAINVDMMLLSDLESENCGLEMVAGGCDYDCHRRRFKTKLITMAMLGYNRVIIEPSGVFDVDEFFDILHEDPLDRLYDIGNVIAIVKADLEEDMSLEADYMLASQIAEAGMVLLSRTQEVSREQCKKSVAHINDALKKMKCNRIFRYDDDGNILNSGVEHAENDSNNSYDLIARDWDELTKADYEVIENSGFKTYSCEKKISMDDNGFDALFFMNLDMDLKMINAAIEKLFSDSNVGRVIRVKGFANENDNWYEINATKKEISVNPISHGQDVIIVIGEDLDRNEIDRCFLARFSTIKTS